MAVGIPPWEKYRGNHHLVSGGSEKPREAGRGLGSSTQLHSGKHAIPAQRALLSGFWGEARRGLGHSPVLRGGSVSVPGVGGGCLWRGWACCCLCPLFLLSTAFPCPASNW